MERKTQTASRDTPPGAEPVRQLRNSLGFTQEEFARALAVTVSTVNRWENGHANPSRLAWRAIQALARKQGLAVPERTGRRRA